MEWKSAAMDYPVFYTFYPAILKHICLSQTALQFRYLPVFRHERFQLPEGIGGLPGVALLCQDANPLFNASGKLCHFRLFITNHRPVCVLPLALQRPADMRRRPAIRGQKFHLSLKCPFRKKTCCKMTLRIG